MKLHECGLPKKMALELFKPFIYARLDAKGLAGTVKAAKKLVEKEKPEVWDILEEVIREHPVLLNRAPTLHRLGIQAFEPKLIEGKAIQLHPLVCAAFNADFDGDQMAVHVPLSLEAQLEARVLMMSTNNILSPANGKPIIVPSQDIVLGLYYLSLDKPNEQGEGMVISDMAELEHALSSGKLAMHAKIKAMYHTKDENDEDISKVIDTTPGRFMISDIFPRHHKIDPEKLLSDVMVKKNIGKLIDEVYRHCGQKATVIFADRLMALGFREAAKAGISFGKDDMKIPAAKVKLVEQTKEQVSEYERQYADGLITRGEKYIKVVDAWSTCTDKVADAMMDAAGEAETDKKTGRLEETNSVFMMADSGARGSAQQIRQLAGMRGLMAKPSGEIIETPITANFREGLSVLEYFTSTHGARKGLADTALKTASSGYLTRRLVDVAQDATIAEYDCGTTKGIQMVALREGTEIKLSIGDRTLGRTLLDEVIDHNTGEKIAQPGDIVDEELAQKLDDAGIEIVRIRSVLTCNTRMGICAKCYGRDLATGHLINVGEAIGVIAAQSIGEPGTQLTMRTFHFGGTVTHKVEKNTLETNFTGIVKFERIKFVTNREGHVVVLSRNGEIKIVDKDTGALRDTYPISYGSVLLVKEEQEVEAGDSLAEWDPFAVSILAEVGGGIKYIDMKEGQSIEERTDEVTFLTRKVVIETRGTDLKPALEVVDASGKAFSIDGKRDARYALPVGATVFVENGSEVAPGDVIAKIPRETAKTKDITGGLPRVAELFEARKPKDVAIMSDRDGTVSFGADSKGKRKILVVNDDGESSEFLIPKGRHVVVSEGDYIRKGESIVDGAQSPHDILTIMGNLALARFLVDEIQDVYRLQGVKINDKHIEVIVRQMSRRVKVLSPGDTRFLPGEQVERFELDDSNLRVKEEGGQEATFEPLLLGITKASLSTDSFISAASFQETTKVLTEAAINSKVDSLRGLKENVIMGRLIPAGTGSVLYRHLESAAKGAMNKVETSEMAEVTNG